MSRKRIQFNPKPSHAEAWNNIRADYNAARTQTWTRQRSGVGSMSRNADYSYRNQDSYFRMMELSRDMMRNDPIIGHAVNQLTDNVVQKGFTLDPTTGDDEANKLIQSKWKKWASDPALCDTAKQFTFGELEKLAFQATVVDGDFFALGTKSGALEGVEGHRVRTPSQSRQKNVVIGIKLNEFRQHMQVWVTRNELGPLDTVKSVKDVRKFDVRDKNGHLQVFQTAIIDRLSQTRGISPISRVTDFVTMHDDIQLAAMIKQQVSTSYAIIRERESGFKSPGTLSMGESGETAQADGGTIVSEEIGPGMEIIGVPGEKISMHSPNIPGSEFFKHTKLILQIIAVNLNLPVQMLLLDPSDTNFSGWRGSINQAQASWRQMQEKFAKNFHKPIYEWKMRQMIVDDPEMRALFVRIGDDIFNHKWNPPGWPYIQPFEEAKADALKLEKGLTSPTQLHSIRGQDYQEVAKQIVIDNALMVTLAKEAAVTINTAHPDGDPVGWRELSTLTSVADAPVTPTDDTTNGGDDGGS